METSSLAVQNTPSPYVPSMNTVQSVMAIVEMAYKSGMVKVKNLDDARFIALYGLELSIPVMTSLRCIYSVNGGAPTCSGELLLALIRRSGKVSIKISSTEDTMKAEKATVYMKRLDSGDDFTATWGKADSARAGIGGNNHTKYPAQMWTWRAVSICAKALCSDIVGGMYTIDEIYPETNLDENGEAVGEIVISKTTVSAQPAPVQIPATDPVPSPTTPVQSVAPVTQQSPAEQTVMGIETVGTHLGVLKSRLLKEVFNGKFVDMNNCLGKLTSEGKLPATMTVDAAFEVVKDANCPKTEDEPPADEKPATPKNPPPAPVTTPVQDEAGLRTAALARLEGEQVDIYEVQQLKYVSGTGLEAGQKWLGIANFTESDNTDTRVDIILFPEDVTAITKAGHVMPRNDGPVSIPVIIHIEDHRIRINREKQPLADRTPIRNPFSAPEPTSDQLFNDLPAESDAKKHMMEPA